MMEIENESLFAPFKNVVSLNLLMQSINHIR